MGDFRQSLVADEDYSDDFSDSSNSETSDSASGSLSPDIVARRRRNWYNGPPERVALLGGELNFLLIDVANVARPYDHDAAVNTMRHTVVFDGCDSTYECYDVFYTSLRWARMSIVTAGRAVELAIDNFLESAAIAYFEIESTFSEEMCSLAAHQSFIDYKLAQCTEGYRPSKQEDEEIETSERNRLRLRAHVRLTRSNERNLLLQKSIAHDQAKQARAVRKKSLTEHAKRTRSYTARAFAAKATLKKLELQLERLAAGWTQDD